MRDIKRWMDQWIAYSEMALECGWNHQSAHNTEDFRAAKAAKLADAMMAQVEIRDKQLFADRAVEKQSGN